MKTIEITVPNLQWYGDESLTLEFPEAWDIKRCCIASEGEPALSEESIRAALESPLGTKPLSELGKKADEVVLLIDDMTRPTKSWQYVNPILESLHKAGVPRDNIRFIMAPGSHGTFARLDFVKKLGVDVVAEYQCYNHNPYDILEYLGETSRGTPVHINAEVMDCDLKIGVGTVLFHRLMGFSGGGKMIIPGVSGIDTIAHNHGEVGGFGPGRTPSPSTGYLANEGNDMRLDAEEGARIAGLDFKVDAVLNLNRDPISVFTGDFVETQRGAAEAVKRWHASEAPREMDIVVANTYMRANEAQIGMWPASQSVKEDGTIVLMANDLNGEINHWIFGHHGKKRGARLWSGGSRSIGRAGHLIIYSPYKMRSYDMRYGPPEKVTWFREWNEVLEVLRAEHGSKARVAVLPDATSGIPEMALKG